MTKTFNDTTTAFKIWKMKLNIRTKYSNSARRIKHLEEKTDHQKHDIQEPVRLRL
jgi:hypothetical protein